MRLGKNKKKQWRRCAPGIEDDIIKSNQLKEIDDASFSVTGKLKHSELKYSTVPRVITKKTRRTVRNDAIDLWAQNDKVPVLSNRRKSIMEHKSKYVKPEEIIHPGTSWFPDKIEHANLLDMLEKDQIRRIIDQEKYKMKEVFEEDTENSKTSENKEEMEDKELDVDELMKVTERKKKPITTKKRKQKLVNLKLEIIRKKEKMKQKGEAHGLRNLPKFCKEIKRTQEEQKKKLEAAKELEKQKKVDKIVKEQIHRMPFQLPSELAPNLRSMQSEGDLMQELCDKVKGHKFKVEKPKKMKKKVKMYKKKGLV